MQITEAELLDAMQEASKDDPEAKTSRELREELGCSEKALNKALRVLAATGRLVITRVHRLDLAGRPTTIPAYTVLAQKPKKR